MHDGRRVMRDLQHLWQICRHTHMYMNHHSSNVQKNKEICSDLHESLFQSTNVSNNDLQRANTEMSHLVIDMYKTVHYSFTYKEENMQFEIKQSKIMSLLH